MTYTDSDFDADPSETFNPFPGLRPFETDEYTLFFGREGQSDELLARLGRTRFLAVVGTSGSGKSSLIRAGLLPALYGGLMAGAGSAWRVALFRPGGDPVGNLAAALCSEEALGAGAGDAEVQAAIVEATLRRSTLGLVDVVRQARLAPYENLLVVVDQFEELFRFRSSREAQGSEDDAAAFVKLLLEAPQQRAREGLAARRKQDPLYEPPTGQEVVPIYVVLTMRSDFLGDCAQFQGLPEAINDGQYLIPRMTRDERRAAITGPAAVGGGDISLPLVNRLLNDVGDNPDQLPIMQHALMRTWEHWASRCANGGGGGRSCAAVELSDYEAVGGMTDALSRHADEAWGELTDERSRLVAEKMFKALTEKGADNREIRRPATLGELCEIAEATPEEVSAVVETFRREGRSFLMPPAGTPLTKETVIDISHESLIRNWERLKKWVDEEAQSARIYRRLAEAAVLHREGREGLMTDPGLQFALDWRDRHQPNAAWARRYQPEFELASTFLDASREEHDARAAAERERERRELEQARAFAEQQARSARRLRRLVATMVVLFLLSLVAVGVALKTMQVARDQRSQIASMLTAEEALRASADRERERLAATLRAKEEAEMERTRAEMAQQEAEASEAAALRAAVAAKERAEKEARRADQEARHAEQEAAQARRAEQEAKQRARALEANGLFRDATILAEQGKFQEALHMYEQTIVGLQENGVNDTEGMADTYVLLGQTHFSAMEGTELESWYNNENVMRGVENYETAVKYYEEAGLPLKAADVQLSVGHTLLKIGNGVPVGREVSRDREVLGTLPINRKTRRPLRHDFSETEEDMKVEFKNQALERYKSAFLLYRKSENEVGMMRTAYRIGNFYLRDELPAREDKTPTLDVGACSGAQPPSVSNKKKAICYFKELERLLLARGRSDSSIYHLLVWVGGIYHELGEGAAAETYFNRAQQVFSSLDDPDMKKSAGHSWGSAAASAEEAELYDAALELYRRAAEACEREGNFSCQAAMLFKTGNLLRRHGENTSVSMGATPAAMDAFTRAIETFKKGPAGGDGFIGVGGDEFLTIGTFAEENYEEELALEAHKLALALGKANGDKLTQARAWSGTASVEAQNSPEDARQSYMRSFALYSELRDELSKRSVMSGRESEEYLKELERISAAVISLDREIKTKAAAAQQKPRAGSFCPFPVIAYAQPTAIEGDAVTFSAYAVFSGEWKLNYEWTFSSPAATVVAREQKPYPAVRVSTDGVGKHDLTATLVVTAGSGANACRQTAQATTKVAARPAGL